MNHSAKLFYLSMLLCLLIPVASSAAEQRCNELGANCICSEPLNTNVMPRSGNYYNPGDSTTKECTSDGTANYPVYSQQLGVTASGTGTPEYTALPSGHNLTYVWREATMTGISVQSFGPESATSFANLKDHMVARWYMYLSPDVNHESDPGGCHGSKYYFLGNQANNIAFYIRDYWGQQNWLATNINRPGPGFDCCGSAGPRRPGSPLAGAASLKGRWTRFELVVQNAKTNGLILELFIKRLGLDANEFSIMYSGSGSVDLANWWNASGGHPTASEFANMRISPNTSGWEFRKFAPTLYRDWQADTTACNGYPAFTHMMVAGWDGAYTGQRIGPAYEIEGVRPNPAPNAPATFRIIP